MAWLANSCTGRKLAQPKRETIRIRFEAQGKFVNPRQPQLELKPFTRERLREVALKLRSIYPTEHSDWLLQKVTEDFIDRLVDQVTEGFKGDVGVIPRQFLRRFVDVLDLASTEPEYEPMQESGFKPINPNQLEQCLFEGTPYIEPDPEGEDDKAYALVNF